MHIGRLAELDNTKHIVVACDGLVSLIIGTLREINSNSAFLSSCPTSPDESPNIMCSGTKMLGLYTLAKAHDSSAKC